jgi:predicted DNA-binding transcriptional regulator AlpA
MPRASGRTETISWVPRGLCKEEAAYYIGVGTTKFDELVADRRMPRGKRIDGRVVWDRVQIDMAFSDLGEASENAIDAALRKTG